MSFKGKKIVRIKNLTLSPRRGISRSSEDLTASIGPRCHFSHPGEPTLAQARILQYSPRFHPPRVLQAWPKTCHRLCIWHLYQNAMKKLSHVFAEFREFSKDFSKCIYEYEEDEDFIEAWNNMLNNWLEQTFALKKKWALFYGRHNFCADMTTTQRSESMSSLIKNMIVVMMRQRQILKQLKKMIQFEVSIAYDSSMHVFYEEENIIEYKVIPYKKQFQHTVKYDTNSSVVTCSCKKFEFSGILCSHALKVLSSRNIVKIPEMYILKRWTKDAKSGSDKNICHNVFQEDPKAKMASWYIDLCRLHADLATKGAQNEEVYKIGVNGLIKTMEAMDACLRGSYKETKTHGASIINTENACGNNNNIKGLKIKEKSCGSSK
ncbi:hypothetical protein Lal_00030174 [Lupinus albus]|nr:hypothetical protein Lal_00030174 [Lupinus albus]